MKKPKWQHVSALCEQANKNLKINLKKKKRTYVHKLKGRQQVSTFSMPAKSDDLRARASSFSRLRDMTNKRHSVPHPWTSDQPYTETSYLTTHNAHTRQDIRAPSRIQTHNLNKEVAADPRLRLRGHITYT